MLRSGQRLHSLSERQRGGSDDETEVRRRRDFDAIGKKDNLRGG
jgi:hypothetical protein